MTDPRLIRAPRARVIDGRGHTTVLGLGGQQLRFDGEQAALVREILTQLSLPKTRQQLLLDLQEALSSKPFDIDSVDQAIAHLRQAAVVKEAGPKPAALPRPTKHLVLGLTGAVASSQAPAWLPLLHERGFQVWCALTEAARQFVQPMTLEVITHAPVAKGLWDRSDALPVPHVSLAQWADVMLVCPTTATTLARLVAGDCSDLVSATAITTNAPVVLVPSMSPTMLSSPSVQRNLGQLRDDGFHIVHSGYGVEVTDRPSDRTFVSGPMPLFEDILDLVELVLASRLLEESADRKRWDQHYASDQPRPWHVEALDADMADALSVLPKGERALDIGTGLGTVARELAKRGYKVVATDVSNVALKRAKLAAGDVAISFVHDDIQKTRVLGPFSLAVDRGVLHHVSDRDRYLENLAQLVSPGGHLLVKVHADDDTTGGDSTRYSSTSLQRFFEPHFEALRVTPSQLGPAKALFGVFRRNS